MAFEIKIFFFFLSDREVDQINEEFCMCSVIDFEVGSSITIDDSNGLILELLAGLDCNGFGLGGGLESGD